MTVFYTNNLNKIRKIVFLDDFCGYLGPHNYVLMRKWGTCCIAQKLLGAYFDGSKTPQGADCVDQSERGGKVRVFRGLAGLLRGISRGQSQREIPRSNTASPRKTPSFLTLLLQFTFYFQHGFSKY